MIKRVSLIIAALALVSIGAWFLLKGRPAASKEDKALTVKVKKGEFKVKVTATGELQAKRSEKIRGPQGMRTNGIWQTSISDMVAEGTLVKEGDYVATLDKTELSNRIRDSQTELDKILTQLEQAKIDTAIELRGVRDQLVNLKFLKKEKDLQLEQSKYEPQSVIQQARLDLERTERDYQQLLKKYDLTKEKSDARISEINTSMRQIQTKLTQLTDLANEFVVKAPKGGMVIYARSWNGKVGPGSQVHAWDPIVAELPDLTSMISKTYVNEVDISKVKKGQDVKVKIDAFPDREYTGKVIQVANIGEQLKDYDAKVFEVTIQVNEADSVMRPAMTTSNEIVTYIYPDVVFIPLESLQSDSLSFVYKKTDGKIVRQEVITGESNDDEVIVEYGLAKNDEIFLTPPADVEKLPFVPLDKSIKEKIKKKQEAERKKRQEEALARSKAVKDENLPTSGGNDGMFIIIE
ncbi:MAG: efflux RND transporter periplasmic adaptor subunit [Saprospiraceae bacterium]|jgi:multidrug efflux pump subunit AcrA (membrane-fusion protein)|nr:efflux RND transporter periplasmic adaptor subunit [Saprospiraceae bacterium]